MLRLCLHILNNKVENYNCCVQTMFADSLNVTEFRENKDRIENLVYCYLMR